MLDVEVTYADREGFMLGEVINNKQITHPYVL